MYRPAVHQAPDSENTLQSLMCRFWFRDVDRGQSGKISRGQSGKISWRSDEARSKLIFFSALNQGVLEMWQEGERTTLFNLRRKTYWQGPFRTLILRMWGIDLDFADLQAIVLAGEIPQSKMETAGLTVSLEKDGAGNVTQGVIGGEGISLRVRISQRERRSGTVVFFKNMSEYSLSDLNPILDDD